MQKKYLSWDDVAKMTQDILRQMSLDEWKPDYVVGIARGGLVPAVMISQYLDVPMYALKVSLRDHYDTESNSWMAEDAFGYIPEEERENAKIFSDSTRRKKILIVDDINDTGATFNWIQDDWQSGCLPINDEWNNIWHDNVRFAVLYDNEVSKSNVHPQYCGVTCNKHTDPQWIVFPWEEFWKHEG